jgi:ribosomal peptide maturation radical SAM protein 1
MNAVENMGFDTPVRSALPTSQHDRVVLVTMPFGPIEYPSLGLGLLAAHCRRADVPCDTEYLALSFANRIGISDYVWIARDIHYQLFAGEWVFAEALYGPRPDADAEYLDLLADPSSGFDLRHLERLKGVREAVPAFMDDCDEVVDWGDYSVVGFTSVFQQNLASLALASRLKARHPHLTVAFGGANWETPMGPTLQRRFPFVDLAFSGEADHSWPAVLEARRRGEAPVGIAGVTCRGAAASARTTGMVHDLDTLPVPDYEPYFDQLGAAPRLMGVRPSLLLETARGCWWGERSHCTFCGINGSTMAFRSKSPERAVEEVGTLVQRYRFRSFGVVDPILDMRYFRTVLPRLAQTDLDAKFCWEVKANLTRRQVAQLAAAGVVTIQPGIESLSDHVLELMRKGTTAARNIELLKWCAEYGVRPLWNLIYGFPGERAEDYDSLPDLIKAIWHLPAPASTGPISLDRYSPYHETPDQLGVVDLRPARALRALYPFEERDLMNIAYYFDFDYADDRNPETFVGPALPAVHDWLTAKRRGCLWLDDVDGHVLLTDTRHREGLAPLETELAGWQASVLLACDRAQSWDDLTQLPAVLTAGVNHGQLAEFLGSAVERRWSVWLESKWLTVAVHRPARLHPASDLWRSRKPVPLLPSP